MEKILLMHVAAQLTEAACGAAPVPVSPELDDPKVRAKNLYVWETFRVFYRAAAKAAADNDSWPPPPAAALPELLTRFVPLAGADLAALLKRLADAAPAGTHPNSEALRP